LSATATEIRRARSDDAPALAKMLARAFMDDPVAEWACRPHRLRPSVLEHFQGGRMHQFLHHDEVWCNDSLTSAAIWAPPGRWKTTLRQDLVLARGLLAPRLLPRAPLVIWGMLGIEKHHPHERPPHFYLAVLGTEPSAQGNGFGSAVLQGVLRQCDEDGVGAYLESSKESNIGFYSRHGFRVIGELRLPRGPKMWPMWRDPRP
jgi:ribosomal protein S18 acetylase RimI-like enzyme